MTSPYLTPWTIPLACMFCAGVNAQTIDEQEPLSLTIRPYTKQIVPYEPIPIIVTIRNESNRPAKFDENYFHRVEFFCRLGEGRFEPCAYSKNSGVFSDGPLPKLAPGSARADEELLFWRDPMQFEGEAFVFPWPGAYEIKAKTEGLESNVVEVKIKGSSARQTAIAKLFTQPDVARFIQGFGELRGKQREQVAEEVRRLVAKYPDSRFADHANFSLARFFAWKYFMSGSRRKWSRETYQHFGAVSPRIAELHTRASCRQAYLFSREPHLRSKTDFYLLKVQLLVPCGPDDTYLKRPYSLAGARSELRGLEILFVEDDRLDKKVDYRLGKPATYAELLKHVSQKTGVSLAMNPLGQQAVLGPTVQGTATLREFLYQLSGLAPGLWRPGRDLLIWRWEPRDGGYFLGIGEKRKLPIERHD